MTDENEQGQELTQERREQEERREGDRRGGDQRASDRRQGDRRMALDRRRGPGRRRNDDRKAAEEGEMNDEQFEFIMAVEEYRRVNKRPFPSLTEILEIAKALGYRKVAEPESLVGAVSGEESD